MADGAASPGPIRPAERIDAIDVLRGVALFGVMAINVTSIFRVSIFEQFLFPMHPASPLDRVVETVLKLAVDLKAFALFSLLFGVGLAMQFERLSASPRRTVLLVRRLIVLLAFGVIHLCLIWNGDILTEYAIAGFIVDSYRYEPELMKVIVVEVTRAANTFGRTHLAKIREAYEQIADIVARAQAQGVFRSEITPEFGALAFYGSIEQVLTRWIFDRDAVDDAELEAAKRMIVETICRGLERDPASSPPTAAPSD